MYKEIILTIFVFYKFKKIKFLKQYKSLFQEEISKENIRGTIILSLEPIMEPPKRFKDNAKNYGYKKADAVVFKIGQVS